jgi:hypothetical protein
MKLPGHLRTTSRSMPCRVSGTSAPRLAGCSATRRLETGTPRRTQAPHPREHRDGRITEGKRAMSSSATSTLPRIRRSALGGSDHTVSSGNAGSESRALLRRRSAPVRPPTSTSGPKSLTRPATGDTWANRTEVRDERRSATLRGALSSKPRSRRVDHARRPLPSAVPPLHHDARSAHPVKRRVIGERPSEPCRVA